MAALLGICFWREGLEAALGPEQRGERGACLTRLSRLSSATLGSRQPISSLPSGFAGSNFCSGILVSEDGKFVYLGNRLHDSVGIFLVGEAGELSFVADEWQFPAQFQF